MSKLIRDLNPYLSAFQNYLAYGWNGIKGYEKHVLAEMGTTFRNKMPLVISDLNDDRREIADHEEERADNGLGLLIPAHHAQKILETIQKNSAILKDGINLVSVDQLENFKLGPKRMMIAVEIDLDELEDNTYDPNPLLASIGELIATTIDRMFIEGNRDFQPEGIIGATTVAVLSRPDRLIKGLHNLQKTVSTDSQEHYVWVMNPLIMHEIMEADTNYEIIPLEQRKGDYLILPHTMLGSRVIYNDYMDQVNSGSYPVFYGDFSQYKFYIDEEMSIRRVEPGEHHDDDGTGNDNPQLFISMWIDGRLINSQAVRVLRIVSDELLAELQ